MRRIGPADWLATLGLAFAMLGVAIVFSVGTSAADIRRAGCERSSFRIALDVGHDRTRPGATSARGITEFTYNRALASLVLAALKSNGFTSAFLIGESGEPIALAARSQTAKEQHADLFISLHHDSAQRQFFSEWIFEGRSRPFSDTFHGYSIFVSVSSVWATPSLAVAVRLGRALRAHGLTPTLHHAEPIPGENRTLLDPVLGVYRFDELAVLRGAVMPALLLEGGVIVNREEEQAIQSGTYHPKIAAALVEAIADYCAMTR
jgi:N-acetylmuramoyl-L-alanine amidase